MKILVATPSGRGLFSGGFVTSMLQTITMLKEFSPRWAYEAHALVARSRNRLAAKAIREEDDVIIMIDDDMVWEPEAVLTVLDLLQGGAPIVAIAASKRSYPLTFPARFVEGGDLLMPRFQSPGIDAIRVREAKTVGTGFMAIQTRALVEMARHTKFVSQYPDIDRLRSYRFFHEGLVNTPDGSQHLLGEDETFVIMAREMGIKTIVPIDVTIGHEGMHNFVGRASDHHPELTPRGSERAETKHADTCMSTTCTGCG